MFKIKIGYKVELETPGKMKLFGSTKKIKRQKKKKKKEKKNLEKKSLPVDEVVLVQCNWVDNRYQVFYFK